MRVRNEQSYNEKKAQIMEACYECYAENGLHGTGIAALAEAAKISRATFYLYFKDIDDLIIQSTDYCMTKVEDEFMEKAPKNPEPPALAITPPTKPTAKAGLSAILFAI